MNYNGWTYKLWAKLIKLSITKKQPARPPYLLHCVASEGILTGERRTDQNMKCMMLANLSYAHHGQVQVHLLVRREQWQSEQMDSDQAGGGRNGKGVGKFS